MNKKILGVLILSILVTGLSCKKEKSTGLPPGHGEKKETKVVIPTEITKEWKSVKILLSDKQTNTKKTFDIEIGKKMDLSDSGLTLEVLNFVPDFKMSPGEITSASGEPKNPAVQVIVSEGEKKQKLWLFYHYPDVHSFVHPRYQISLVGFDKK